MESALTQASNGLAHPESAQIILPTEEEKKRIAALTDVKALHERTLPLLVPPTNADAFVFLGEQLKLIRVAKKTLVDTWRPHVDDLLRQKNEAYASMMEGVGLMNALEATGDRLFLDYDRIQREATERQQRELQTIVNDQSQHEAQIVSVNQRLDAAIEAEAAGNHDLAEEILNAETPAPAVMPAVVVLQSHTPQVSGMSKRITWKGRLKGASLDNPVPPASLALLVIAVAEDLKKAPEERRGLIGLLKLNDSALTAMAKAMKAQLNIPGCESYEETGLAKRV